MSRARLPRSALVGMGLLAIAVVGSALALGALLPVPLYVVSVLAAASSFLLWLDPPARLTRSSQWVLGSFAVLQIFTILQCVPLPAGVVHVIAPANAEIWARALAPLHEAGPSWHPISVAPAATQIQVVRGFFYVSVFLAALRISTMEGGRTFLETLVVASACIVALAALAHPAVNAKTVFGLYRPREIYAYMPGRYGPLLNTNHLSAYAGIGSCVAIGVVAAGRRRRSAPLIIAAAVLLAGTAVWAGSRGGTGALILGTVLVIGLSVYAKRGVDVSRVQRLIGVLVVIGAAAFLGFGTSEFARSDLSDHDFSKLDQARNALELVRMAPLFGFGRGAFETVFPLVRTDTFYATATHPENIVAQWSSEWGLPLSVVAASMLVWAFRPAVVLTASRPVVGAWAALVATVLHDLVDFHLEVPGVMALVTVCAALIVGGRMSSASQPARPLLERSARPLAQLAVVGVLIAIGFALPNTTHALAEDRVALSEAALDDRVGNETFRLAVRAAMLRYPGEAFFPLAGAVRAQHTDEGDVAAVLPWIGGALERNPRFGRAHLVLARSLARGHRAQARLEYRLAYESDSRVRAFVRAEAPRLVDDLPSALELVPDGPEGVEVLEPLIESISQRLPSTAVALDAELARRAPEDTGPVRRRVRAALSDISSDYPWCADRAACVRDALAAAVNLEAREPALCEAHTLRARLRIAAGDVSQALEDLGHSIDNGVADATTCRRELVILAVQAKQRRRAEEALDLVIRSGCSEPASCAELYGWAGSTQESLGNLGKAVTMYRRAADATPENDGFLQRIGELGPRTGRVADSVEAYGTLIRRHPENTAYTARLAELRAHGDESRHGITPPAP